MRGLLVCFEAAYVVVFFIDEKLSRIVCARIARIARIGDRLNLPQFNGYFKSATMSHKEYPNHETKKTLYNLY